MTRERIGLWTRIVLWIVGVIDCTAAVPVLMPRAAMDAVHRFLGMGPLPAEPIVEYLARSVSMFYVFRGVLFLYAAQDVEGRYGLIRLLAWSSVVMGFTLLGIDLAAGMPPSWTRVEWSLVVGPGSLLLLLTRWWRRTGRSVDPVNPAPPNPTDRMDKPTAIR